MSDLSHVDVSKDFVPRDEGWEGGEPVPALAKRKPERVGKPRAAQFDSLDARLDQIARDAAARWQEQRA